jgi:hypothetical protein
MKPFTTITALLLLLGAAIHGYRLYTGFPVVIDAHHIPMWASYLGVAIPAFLAIMLFVEARR